MIKSPKKQTPTIHKWNVHSEVVFALFIVLVDTDDCQQPMEHVSGLSALRPAVQDKCLARGSFWKDV